MFQESEGHVSSKYAGHMINREPFTIAAGDIHKYFFIVF